MARAATKCAGCGDLLWFADTDEPPQAVVCCCGECALTEGGPEGTYEQPTPEELEGL